MREMNSTTLHIVTFATPQIAMLLSLWESQLCAVARMDRAASYVVHLHTVGAASAHGDTGAISVPMLMRARLKNLAIWSQGSLLDARDWPVLKECIVISLCVTGRRRGQ